MQTHEIMTLKEVADYLHCHTATIYRMVKRGSLPVWKIGSDYRFTRKAVDEWIEQQAAKV